MLEELIAMRVKLDGLIAELTQTPNLTAVPDGLTPIETSLFLTLAAKPGQWIGNDEMMRVCNRARNRDGEFTEDSLWVHIHRLRKKLKGATIINGRGVGYMLKGE